MFTAESMIETLLKTIANHLKIFKTVLFLQNMEKFKNNIGKSTFYNSIDKQYYELLVDDPTTPAVILTYIFFRFFNY